MKYSKKRHVLNTVSCATGRYNILLFAFSTKIVISRIKVFMKLRPLLLEGVLVLFCYNVYIYIYITFINTLVRILLKETLRSTFGVVLSRNTIYSFAPQSPRSRRAEGIFHTVKTKK